MTPSELKEALDRLSESEFADFRRQFGGDYPARQGYVDAFVHHPEYERRLCQLLRLPTEVDKQVMAATTSANAAADSVSLARRANVMAILAILISLAALFQSSCAD